ncbi:TNF receptor-associated factor 5 isoform X2 [Hydra vulgaris]|uniref:TNF receptor-associated factor 5 isoform X2 n=1 Tax=Hydra vulgaris TaxID=6087 RepID=UPI001F5F7974|nr:TNF receptor-associated factor 5-like isoform X2 [Hydra vulgaris]
MAENRFGGYNAHFLHELSDEHECPVCKMALREPILTACGHRFCLSCSEEIRKINKGVLFCPLDKTKLKSEQTFRDKAVERAILQLKVKCNNFLKDCQWTGELRAINNHLSSCEYQEVKCLNKRCFASLLSKELCDHMETKCIYRLVTCQHCNQKIPFCEKQAHEEYCKCLPLYCVNQCGMKILREEMLSHIHGSCANTIVPCQYFHIGCNFKGMRKDQDTHANSSTQNHLSMAISKVAELEINIMLLKEELESKMPFFEYDMGMRKEQDTHASSSTQDDLPIAITKVADLETKIMLIEQETERKIAFLKYEMMEKINLVGQKTEQVYGMVLPSYDEVRTMIQAIEFLLHNFEKDKDNNKRLKTRDQLLQRLREFLEKYNLTKSKDSECNIL